MSESVKGRMSRHKQLVIAALAVSVMLMYAIPAQQAAIAQDLTNDPDQDLAQSIIDETNQDIDQEQDQEQDIDQEQDQDVTAENTADQSNEANIDQSEENNQNNIIATGDNDATTTQSGSNEANENSAAAASEGGSGGDVWDTGKKAEVKSSGGDSEAEAEVGIEQEVDNEAVTVQDSSATGNTLSNTNTFGNDVAVVTKTM